MKGLRAVHLDPVKKSLASTIEGALKHYFGIEVPAVGFFEESTCEFSEFTYSVRDKFLGVSKVPIITAYLKPKSKTGRLRQGYTFHIIKRLTLKMN